jgi:hypothetical protein
MCLLPLLMVVVVVVVVVVTVVVVLLSVRESWTRLAEDLDISVDLVGGRERCPSSGIRIGATRVPSALP